MLKLIITEAVVSKGYNDDPAVRYFSSNSENTGQVANFRIGKRVYDSKAEKNHRWLNFTVKAFGDMCERVKRMKLKEGSYINIIARYDEETWETKDTHETRTGVVLYLDERVCQQRQWPEEWPGQFWRYGPPGQQRTCCAEWRSGSSEPAAAGVSARPAARPGTAGVRSHARRFYRV